ncbi:tRNA pseudouridine synthase A [Faecalicatena acetigenes]|uniref:tRNA pseudouridine synthase A n=1 Tax=Faecalicatena acetigenes TaxID=2981790 RepID=A0ABT2T7Z2_9FIRM|nr:tRNA pseudouridine synthase A [Faecalicatena acetigenes]MCU6746383.1 tRNA pseudouridine synthase A [Faecalicatena acetigenes]SCH15537.1 tRNA pseudouridine synthase A [uncultured Clostridium sp.]
MQNILLTIEYDGTRYLGWQRPAKDKAFRTISYKISEVLRRLTGESSILNCASKTEPGVHALAQEASFLTTYDISMQDLTQYLNTYLPQDIAIRRACRMQERFRADLNAKTRTYLYHICTAAVQDIFTQKYSLHLFPAPDIERMQEAASSLIGRQDFQYFSSGRSKKKTEQELLDIQIEQTADFLSLSLTATDFLPHMPLLIIGTLLDIGTGRQSIESAEAILKGRKIPGRPCDAKALFLKKIDFR